MGSRIFLDASGWLALLNSGDPVHNLADEEWRKLIQNGSEIVLTDWIIAETGNGSASSLRKHRVMEAIRATIRDPRVELIYVNDELLKKSCDLFSQHADKSWGLVDCASFLVMRDRGIADAFTCDRHFEQAGFRSLLTP